MNKKTEWLYKIPLVIVAVVVIFWARDQYDKLSLAAWCGRVVEDLPVNIKIAGGVLDSVFVWVLALVVVILAVLEGKKRERSKLVIILFFLFTAGATIYSFHQGYKKIERNLNYAQTSPLPESQCDANG